MTEEENSNILSSLFDVLTAYQDTQEGLARVKAVAQSVFGDEWRKKLPSVVEDAPDDIKASVQKNISRALAYEQAVSAWTEASRILDPRLAVPAEKIKQRLPVLQKPLLVFGQAGKDMYAKLEQHLAQLEKAGKDAGNAKKTPAAQATASAFGLTVEQLWSFDHFMRLRDYYDQTISRTSARCVHLGGLEMSQYPYYGYILDLLDELLTFGHEIVTVPVYQKIIQEKYKGGIAALNKNLSEYQKEFEDNAPPDMINDTAEIDDIKSRLGELAQDKSDGDIGPAPDGFVSPDEQEQQMQPVQPKQPVQPAPIRKAPPPGMPVKRPAPAPVTAQRPAPQG